MEDGNRFLVFVISAIPPLLQIAVVILMAFVKERYNCKNCLQ